MKYKGRQLTGPKTEILVFPRPATYEPEVDAGGKPTGKQVEINNDIVFKLAAVLDMDEFDTILPPPQPPEVVRPGNLRSRNTEDPSFKASVSEWQAKRIDWMVLRTMAPTADLEWETVKMEDPDTWQNFRTELTESGFNRVEVIHLINKALQINSIDEARMEEARARFLEREAAASHAGSNSPNGDHTTTPSGELVRGSK